jgi:hypothetical protein
LSLQVAHGLPYALADHCPFKLREGRELREEQFAGRGINVDAEVQNVDTDPEPLPALKRGRCISQGSKAAVDLGERNRIPHANQIAHKFPLRPLLQRLCARNIFVDEHPSQLQP